MAVLVAGGNTVGRNMRARIRENVAFLLRIVVNSPAERNRQPSVLGQNSSDRRYPGVHIF